MRQSSRMLGLAGPWLTLAVVLLTRLALDAADWPAYRHDNARSGVTTEQLGAPLRLLWQHQPRHAPRPAMAEAAQTDYWHKLDDLAPRTTYDRTFHVVAAEDAVFLGSSTEDKVYSLDAASGAVRWSFCAGGPVRLAPAYAEGRVYFGSDDGRLYCVDAESGRLVWQVPLAEDQRQIVGNGRLISASPVRTGVVVENGIVHVGAGLFPKEGAWLWAVDARDGSRIWNQQLSVSPQGYLVSSPDHLFVPTGRAAPAVFRRQDGQAAGACPGVGGTEVMVSEGLLCFGPGKLGEIEVYRTDPLERRTLFRADALVATKEVFYLQDRRRLQALDREQHFAWLDRETRVRARQQAIAQRLKELGSAAEHPATAELRREFTENQAFLEKLPQQREACVLWKRPSANRHALILAGETLFAGGDGRVEAYAAADGSSIWTGKVDGAALGLAVAHGRLFVSTDRGTVHAFGGEPLRASSAPVSATAQPSEAPRDWPPDESVQTARSIIERTRITRGFCAVLNCGDGRLVAALASLTDLTVVGIEAEPHQRAAAQTALDRVGLYGPRVSVQSGPVDMLPGGFANLVVCGMGSQVETSQIKRLLQPYNGVAWRGPSTSLVRADPPVGAGEWTHLYADVGNSACSGEERLSGETRVLWFGEPGPRRMADRHHRAVPPLFKEGRLFIPAYDRVLALDGYNGTLLWEREVAGSTRLGAAKDSGYLALASDALYVSIADECVALDARCGSVLRRFPTPQSDGSGYTWGYTATVGDRLFGSGRRPSASLRTMGLSVIEIQYGDRQAVSTSAYLFSLDRSNGRLLWLYHGGLIPDPTIALGDGRLYFVECAVPEVSDRSKGRFTLGELVAGDTQLVALNATSGEVLWSQPLDLRSIQHVIFLSHADETLVVVGSKNHEGMVWYEVSGYDAATGRRLWHREQNNQTRAGGDHGEQTLHPVIIRGIVYAEPFAYHLRSGEPVADWSFSRQGHGCGTLSGSASQLFYRADNPTLFDLRTRQASKLTLATRPGCWINIIPAGGLILVPEASSGCTCGFSIETTIVFATE